MARYARFFTLLTIVGLAWLGFQASSISGRKDSYHSLGEKNFFGSMQIFLPLTNNEYFQASGRCDGCHGYDPTAFANVTAEGVDISPLEYWRGSMMANASKDPFWKAKVSHEITVNPGHKIELEDKCTTCHAPMGKYSYEHFGFGPFPMDSLATDSLAMDGVSCLACHKQSTESLGSTHSGVLHFIDAPVAFGPHAKPFSAPMQEFVGIEAVESAHIMDAGLCAGCHTLITESVDLNGQFTGTTFVEQATYHEWLNSDFNDADGEGKTCQGCHMPRNDDGVVLSANYSFLPYRAPVGLHEFAGANMFMLRLMRNNWQSLGLWADEEDFDRTISATDRMLTQETMDVDLTLANVDNDTAYFNFQLTNKAGHKFPSGYPSRRAFIEFIVTDQNGNQIFASGLTDSEFNLVEEDNNFEQHWNIIDSQQKAQIYEMVMGDVNGNFTTVLERGYTQLKDNRLAPKGFSALHAVYDTTLVIGHATTDLDFNQLPGLPNSGTDIVHYHVPLNGFSGTIKAVARVRYQSIPRKWLNEMFDLNTAPINTFRDLYLQADKSPTTVGTDSITNINIITSITDLALRQVQVYPNPVRNGQLRIYIPAGLTVQNLELMDNNGRSVAAFSSYSAAGLDVSHLVKGVYLLRIGTNKGQVLRKVIVQD